MPLHTRYCQSMAERQGLSRLDGPGWTVESGVLLFDGQPRIDLATVTRAHYRCIGRSYGLQVSSPQQAVMIQGDRWKKFSRAANTALTGLHRSAPQVRVHMRGGEAVAAFNFGIGVLLLCAAISMSVALVVGANDFSGAGVPIALFLALVASYFLWFFNPWHRDRFYATPKQAASAIRDRGWRAPYGTYSPR